MPEWTPQSHLQEAFRKELLRLIDQYLRFPDDATHGKIVRALVMYQQARAVLATDASTLITDASRVGNTEGQSQGRRQKVTLMAAEGDGLLVNHRYATSRRKLASLHK